MQRQHRYAAQIRRRRHSSRHRVRDIVEFQVEEDLKAKARKPVNGSRAFRRVKLAADFQHPGRAAQPPGQSHGRAQAVVVERDDYSP